MKLKLFYGVASIILSCFSVLNAQVMIYGEAKKNEILIQKFSSKFKVDTTSNPSFFSENTLKNYQVVVIQNASINNLNFRQAAEFQRFMKAGGGFVGIGSVAEKSYKWLWFENMMSGILSENQLPTKTQISLITNANIGKTEVSPLWKIEDKPLVFNALPVRCKPVLLDLLGKTWAWYNTTDEGGKMFYTALGIEESAYQNADFLNHISAGIQEVMPKNALDYSKIAETALPNEKFFLKTTVSENLKNPVSFAILPSENIVIVERGGAIKVFSENTQQTNIIGRMDASNLVEIRPDPEFNQNHYIYSFSKTDTDFHKIGRFEMLGDSLAVVTDFSSQSSTPIFKKAVYSFEKYNNQPYRLPKYFDKKSFRYDDQQGFIIETLDENEEVKNIEPFLTSLQFNFVQDLEFGNSGALYFLENDQLQKIDYSEANRKPIAKATANVFEGNAPLKVSFSSAGSKDLDPNDVLSYEWSFGENTISYEPNPEFVYSKIGEYDVKLKVKDSKGDISEANLLIKVVKSVTKKR